jgi:hypothetical protein
MVLSQQPPPPPSPPLTLIMYHPPTSKSFICNGANIKLSVDVAVTSQPPAAVGCNDQFVLGRSAAQGNACSVFDCDLIESVAAVM